MDTPFVDTPFGPPRFPAQIKFLSAILGPEMGASILWTPGKMRSFCGKNHVHKIPRFRGGGVFWVFFWGGGSADFIFMGARIFLRRGNKSCILRTLLKTSCSKVYRNGCDGNEDVLAHFVHRLPQQSAVNAKELSSLSCIGPAIRNANRGGSRKSIRANRLAEKKTYPLTRNYYENNSLRIIFRNFVAI